MANSYFQGATGIGGTDWGSASNTNWGGGFSVDNSGMKLGGGGGGDWTKAASFLGNFLTKMGGDDKDKYRKRAEYDGPRSLGGSRNYFDSGSFGKIGEDISMYVPPQTPQHDPIFIPGGGGPTGPSTGQRFARAGGGALSGAAQGAAMGSVVPGIGTALGAGIGALAGGLGGFFG